MAIDNYTTFEVFVLRCLTILLRFTVGSKDGNKTVDLIEEIERDLG